MKICSCKRKFIREEVESIACYDSCTEAITKIVESECLCGKNYWQMPDGRRLPTSEYDDEKAKCTECTFQISVPEEPDNSSCSEIPNNSGLKECGCRYHNEDCKGEVKENGVCADCPPNCFTEKKDLLGTDLEYEVARTVVRIENDLAYLKDQVDMQPKSPCEHAWRTLSTFDVANNATGGMDVYFTPEVVSLFGCQKCGLVTCKNPFGSDHCQNPNE